MSEQQSLLPVMVTRPAEQAVSLSDALETLGCEVIRHPILRIEPVEETPLLRSRFLDIDHYQAVIAISRNAAESGLAYLDQYWPQLPVGIHWIAVGPVTANAMTVSGMDVIRPAKRFDSEGALALPELQDVAGKKILIWRGVGGREVLAHTLRDRGAQVDYAELYQRIVPQYNDSDWESVLSQRPLLLVSSGQGLREIVSQRPDISMQVRGLVAPGERVAQTAREAGFKEILIADSAQDEDMIASVKQWQMTDGVFSE